MPLSSTAVPLDVCRSWLLTSATDPVRLRSAALSGTDALILDIEDGIPPHRKEHARDIASQWLQHERAWVRINDATTPYWEQDLHTLRNASGLQGIMLAKAESDEQIKQTARLLDSDTPIVALIESAAGIAASPAIAREDTVRRLAFGIGDFGRDTGIGRTPLALAYARSQLVLASRKGGIAGPIDGPTLPAENEQLRGDSLIAVEMGMTGKLCLHPNQIASVNTEFSPSPELVEWANTTLHQLGDAQTVTEGSQLPRIARAHKIIALAQHYGERPEPVQHHLQKTTNGPSG